MLVSRPREGGLDEDYSTTYFIPSSLTQGLNEEACESLHIWTIVSPLQAKIRGTIALISRQPCIHQYRSEAGQVCLYDGCILGLFRNGDFVQYAQHCGDSEMDKSQIVQGFPTLDIVGGCEKI